MQMDKPLYALITGANGGIGQALCQTFSEGGYRVIATDRHPKAEPALVCAHYLSADLANLVNDQDYAERFLTQVRALSADGALQSLINNAAIQILGGADSLTREDWRTTLDVNLLAPFILVQGLLPELEVAQGSVVNISSIHAKLTKRNFVAYATSKAALSGMTRAMAVDLGPRVRVNAIEPAAIETEMLIAGFKDNPSAYEALALLHPSNLIGKTEKLAELVFYICATDNSFLNGAILGFDGGISSCLKDLG